MSPDDPPTQIGVYNPPSTDVPPPNIPPLSQGNPNNPPLGVPDAPPFTESGPFPGYYTPIYTFTTNLIDFYTGTPSYGMIAPGSISDISLGISTAGSGSIPAIPGAGHLYVQLWSFGTPVGLPLQAGDVNGKLLPANFTQSPITQPHVYLNGSPAVLATMAVRMAQGVTAYNQNAANAPAYDPINMNSNTWADGLLLYAGVPQSEITNLVQALYIQEDLNVYGYLNGSQLLTLF